MPPAMRLWVGRHPEWWMLVISLGAWGWLVGPRGTAGCCELASHRFDWHSRQGWLHGLTEWFVMVLAMMFPLMAVPVRVTAFSSLWRRRHLAIGTFLTGYLTVWMVAGVGYLFLVAFLSMVATEWRFLAGIGLLTAAAWQLTALKRRLSTSCHRTRPLAPDGWPAHRDCLRFGVDHGIHCIGNCGVLMFAAMLSPWHQAMMVVTTLLLFYERYRARPRNRTIPLTLGLLAVGHWMYLHDFLR
jgi:predicted metal-binding membrane protein